MREIFANSWASFDARRLAIVLTGFISGLLTAAMMVPHAPIA